MKILYLSPGVFDKGGIARYNRFQVRALQEAFGPNSVRVFSLAGRAVGDLEESMHVQFAGAMPLTRAGRFLFVSEALRAAATFRPEVVLCSHVNMGPMALAIARLYRAHVVQNVYGRELWSKQGLSPARKIALGRADLVISDCHNTADRAVSMGLRSGSPEVVWDCVDTLRYCPGEPNWGALSSYGLSPTDRFRVLFLGRISSGTRYKGFERMLQLVSQLPDRFEAVVAGKGDFVEQLERQAAALGIAHRTTITGAIHEDHMPDIYRAAGAFYLASGVGPNMGEGIPLTPMEAMACGTPVIVGNQDGSRELLDGGGGWCGEPSELHSQASYLSALSGNRSFHASERVAAAGRAASVFNYSRFAAETRAALVKTSRRQK
jgi:phosphatidylinositol alpha-1,6-mannosyltransferase